MSVLVPSARNTLEVGGRVFTDLVNIKVLWARVTSTNYTTMRRSSGSAGYQVTAGKTLRVSGVDLWQNVSTTTAAEAAIIGYADNDLGVNGASTPTNPIYPGNDGGELGKIGLARTPVGRYGVPLEWDIPAAKYPFLRGTNAFIDCSGRFFGYEI